MEVSPSELESVPFNKKPLYYWMKSFAEREIQREDSFSKFLGSSALSNALEYLGITSEGELSSLHLSVIFDEENSGTLSRKFCNQFESETKSRIQSLNRIFNELTSHFEDNFSQLVTIRPPNTVHIATACHACSVLEFEKILFLLLGAAIKGEQKQDTIRRIKGFPNDIQESLISTIKLVTDAPELFGIKPWGEFSVLEDEEQRKAYDSLLGLIRRVILERNSAIQIQLLSDYCCGFTNCEQGRTFETKTDADFEKTFDDNRTNAALRQLREELLEKSDLLQECREELEMTKQSLHQLQQKMAETQQELKNCKKSRDEFDVLREGQEKAARLEAELQKMRKKLENSEQYFERVEILQNENRNFQLKHAILMDQINMLTVDKERLEISFMTQNRNRDSDLYDIENDDIDVVRSPGCQNIKEELLMDSDDNADKEIEIPDTEVLPLLVESELEKSNDIPEMPELTDVQDTPKSSRGPNSKRTKRRHRRASGLSVKRTRKTLFSSKIATKTASATAAGTEALLGRENKENLQESKRKKLNNAVSKRTGRKKISNRRSSEKQVVPHLDVANDADEELSISPNPNGNISTSSSSSDNEIDTETLVPQLPRRLSIIENNNNETGTESDNEFFFVCSAAPPPNRDIQISNGKHVQVKQVSNSRRQYEGSDAEEGDDIPVDFGNCNIQVNLRQVNSHNLNLSHGHSPNPSLIAYRAIPATALVNKIQTFNASTGCHQDSSSEDDDSVWYEYGCV